MQMYKVVTKIDKLEGKPKEKNIDVLMSYTNIYASSPQEAIESVIVQKKIDRKNILYVDSEAVY